MHNLKKYHTIHIRMRKITTAILLIIATTGNVFARKTSADCENSGGGDYCYDGCYLSDTSGTCTACPVGEYDGNSDTDQNTCNSCGGTKYISLLSELEIFIYNGTPPSDIPEGGLWYYDPNYVGAEDESECAVVIKCPAGTGMYLTSDNHTSLTCEKCAKIKNSTSGESDRETDYNYFSSTVTTLNINNWAEYSETGVIINYDGCSECPANSTVAEDHESCKCIAGYRLNNVDLDGDDYKSFNNHDEIDNDNYNTNKNGCVPHTYPVHIYKDCDTTTDPDITKVARYNNTLSTGLGNPQLSKTGYTHTGEYTTTEDKQNTINLDETIKKTEPDTKFDICPVWAANKFEIKYQAGNYIENMPAAFANNSPITENTTAKCEYDAECKISSDTPIATNSAYVFIGWKITDVTGDTLNNGFNLNDKKNPGDSLYNAVDNPYTTIILTAQWQKCPAGYYGCTADNLEGNRCPAGSTSNPGATDITGCFITSATQFCSGETCFTLDVCSQQTDGTWKDCPRRNNTQTTN